MDILTIAYMMTSAHKLLLLLHTPALSFGPSSEHSASRDATGREASWSYAAGIDVASPRRGGWGSATVVVLVCWFFFPYILVVRCGRVS